MRRIGAFALAALMGPMLLYAAPRIDVPLTRAVLPDSDFTRAFRAVYFFPLHGVPADVFTRFSHVEVAQVLDMSHFGPVSIFRMTDSSGAVKYATRETSGSGADTIRFLAFRTRGSKQVADVELPLRANESGDTTTYRVTFQLAISNQQPSIRLAECREGELVVSGKKHAIRLLPPLNGAPLYSVSPRQICFIDLNGDGVFAPGWQIGKQGEITQAERISLITPFIVDETRLEALSVDPQGTTMVFGRYALDTAAAIGFSAPKIPLRDIAGSARTVEGESKKVSLYLFWSTTCPFCEKIRLRYNTVTDNADSSQFRAYSVSLERDKGNLERFLKDTHYGGVPVLYDSVLWHEFNPDMSTPGYCLIDKHGVIRLLGNGAGMFAVVERMIPILLNEH